MSSTEAENPVPNGVDRRPQAAAIGDTSPWAFLTLLVRWRRLIVGLPLGFATLTAGALLLSPRDYRAGASFIPQEPNVSQGGLSQLAMQFGVLAPRSAMGSPQFYADLLQSREVLRDVLITRYHVGGLQPFEGTLLDYLRIPADSSDRTMVRALRGLRGLLTVRVNRVTGVVSFDVRLRNAGLATSIVHRLLELVNDYNLRRRQSQGRIEREFVQQRLLEAHQELTRSEDALKRFYSQNRRFADSPDLVAEEGRLQRQVVVHQQLYVTLTQSFEAAKIDEVRNTPVITIIERPDGFVEPAARGTIFKTLGAGVGGGALALLIALAVEFLRSSRRYHADEYAHFAASVSDAVGAQSRTVARR